MLPRGCAQPTITKYKHHHTLMPNVHPFLITIFSAHLNSPLVLLLSNRYKIPTKCLLYALTTASIIFCKMIPCGLSSQRSSSVEGFFSVRIKKILNNKVYWKNAYYNHIHSLFPWYRSPKIRSNISKLEFSFERCNQIPVTYLQWW